MRAISGYPGIIVWALTFFKGGHNQGPLFLKVVQKCVITGLQGIQTRGPY